MIKRPYFQAYDASGDLPLSVQGDNPLLDETLPIGSSNRRTVYDSVQNGYAIGDLTVNPRGAKVILWSSEGYTNANGVAIPALTTGQKIATGSQATNIGAATGLPANYTPVSASLDASPFRYLQLIVNLTAITGTSIQYELDVIDDAGTPNSIAIWKPSALVAAAGNIVNVGAILGSAPSAPSGWTFTNVNFPVTPNVAFKWTNVATTVATWTAFLYGLY